MAQLLVKRKGVVISVGGSLICPGKTQDLYDTQFIDNFISFIEQQIQQDPEVLFFLVTGGGALARLLIAAGKTESRPLTTKQQDWLGIHATRANAQVVKTKFETIREDIVHPFIIKKYGDIIRKIKPGEQVVCAGGWEPGRSTDFCAVQLCEDYQIDQVINLTNIEQVYEKDPKKDPTAKPIASLKWQEYRENILGLETTWEPGLNLPFDPIAAEFAQRIGIKVAIIGGHDLENLAKCVRGEEFLGTTIEPD